MRKIYSIIAVYCLAYNYCSADVPDLLPNVTEATPAPLLRYSLLNSSERGFSEGNISAPEALTWIKLYHDHNRKESLNSDNELSGTSIEIENLNLTNDAIPSYLYPATEVSSVNISGNAFDNIDFMRSVLFVNGDVNAANIGANDFAPIFAAKVYGDLDISNNPQLKDIALMGYSEFEDGSHINLDPVAQYDRLLDESSPLCQKIINGNVSITSSNGDSGTAYCEIQNEWVLWYQSMGRYTDLTHDAELYGRTIYLNSNIDTTNIPQSKYPVPVVDGFLIYEDATISDTSPFSSIRKVNHLYLQNGANIGNTEGLVNINEIQSLNIGKSLFQNLDSLKNLKEVTNSITFTWTSNLDVLLTDITGIENAIMTGSSVNMGAKSHYTALPLGDSPLCRSMVENNVSLRIGSGATSGVSQFCDSGSPWQEFLEDVGSVREPTLEEGIKTIGFDMSYRNLIMPSDSNIPSVNLEVVEPPKIIISQTNITHLDFLSDVEKTGDIGLYKNGSLTDFDGLKGISAESLTIRENGPLYNLDALEFVTITDSINISANDGYIKDLSFLDRMPVTYKTIRPPNKGPDSILPDGEGPFCKAIEDRIIETSNVNVQDYCDSHPFLEASYDRSISPYAGYYNLSMEFLRDKDVEIKARYIDSNSLYNGKPLPVPFASFEMGDNRSISNLDFMDGMVINSGDVYLGSNLSSLTDISGLEHVKFTDDASGRIVLAYSGSKTRISDIANLDSSVKKLVISYHVQFSDKMDGDGNTCKRIADGVLIIETIDGLPIPYTDYCEQPTED